MVPLGLMNPSSGEPCSEPGDGLRLVVWVGFDGVVSFDGGAALEGAQNLIAASDDLVAFLEAAEDFDVGGAGDAGGDGNEVGAELVVVGRWST